MVPRMEDCDQLDVSLIRWVVIIEKEASPMTQMMLAS